MRAAGRGGCPGGERHSPPRNNARRREPLKLAQPRDATPRTAPGPARPESAAPTPPAPLTSHRSPRGHCRPPRSCPNKRRAAPRPSPPRPAQRCPPPIGSAGRPSSPLRDGPRPLPVFIRSPLVETRPPPARREVIGQRGGAEAGRGRVGKGVLAPRATWVTSGGGAAPPRCFARNGAGRVGRRADPERLEAPGGRFGRSDRGERSAARGTRPQGAALRTGAGKPCRRRGAGSRQQRPSLPCPGADAVIQPLGFSLRSQVPVRSGAACCRPLDVRKAERNEGSAAQSPTARPGVPAPTATPFPSLSMSPRLCRDTQHFCVPSRGAMGRGSRQKTGPDFIKSSAPVHLKYKTNKQKKREDGKY